MSSCLISCLKLLSSFLTSSLMLLLCLLTNAAVLPKVKAATLTRAVKSILDPSFSKTCWTVSWFKAVESRRFAVLQGRKQCLSSSQGDTAATCKQPESDYLTGLTYTLSPSTDCSQSKTPANNGRYVTGSCLSICESSRSHIVSSSDETGL